MLLAGVEQRSSESHDGLEDGRADREVANDANGADEQSGVLREIGEERSMVVIVADGKLLHRCGDLLEQRDDEPLCR